MCCNTHKSTMSFLNLDHDKEQWHAHSFDFIPVNVATCTTYLRYFIRPNDYSKKNWVWMLARVEKCLKLWCNKWISRGGRMILIKSIIEAIPVYWFTLSKVPTSILRRIRILCKKKLWAGKDKLHVFSWTL